MQIVRLPSFKRVDWALALDRPSLDEPVLRVDSIMSRDVVSCRSSDSLNVAAQMMWDKDCGCVPVLDERGHLIGMITDRDICMAAYTQGKNLSDISVASACSRELYACHRDDLVSDAANTMTRGQVRRLPVVDTDGQLVGILTLNDLIRHAWSAGSRAGADEDTRLTAVLEAVSRPRLEASEILQPMSGDERQRLAEFNAL